MQEVINKIVDEQDFFETQAANTPRTSSSALSAGSTAKPVGIVANQPMVLAGCLDINASVKGGAIRVRFCDAFNIPDLTLVDVPGSCPAPTRNTAASSSTAPKLLYAYRRMHGAQGHPDYPQGLRRRLLMSWRPNTCAVMSTLAWPSAEIAVMGPKGAVEIIFREEAKDPDTARTERTEEYRQKVRQSLCRRTVAAYIDDVILPRDSTRKRICKFPGTCSSR